jgi:hypothetical protein
MLGSLIPMRFLRDDTNSTSNGKVAATVGADLCVCPFSLGAHAGAPLPKACHFFEREVVLKGNAGGSNWGSQYSSKGSFDKSKG